MMLLPKAVAAVVILALWLPLFLGPAAGSPSLGGTLRFAGYTWEIKKGEQLGPHANVFAAGGGNVWVDREGCLHLAVTRRGDGKWQCAEVRADRSLGRGEYRWVIAGDLADR